MEPYAISITLDSLPVPAPAPGRGHRHALWAAACVAVVAVLAVVLAHRLAHRQHAELAAQDRPGDAALSLTIAWTTSDPTYGSRFQISLPAAPLPDVGQNVDTVVMTAMIKGPGGEATGALIFRRFDNVGDTPVAALKAMAKATHARGIGTPGAIRRTQVGSMDAWAFDMPIGPQRVIREFRFMHRGHVYGAGLLYTPGEPIALDTGLAALRTFRWLD